MSEFSDCYYFLNVDSKRVVSLLKKIRRYGMVLPGNDRYTPFLVDGAWDAGKLIDHVVENNPGVILHYSYAADHGLWIKVYDSSSEAFTIDIQMRGSSENDLETILVKAEELNVVKRDHTVQLRAILAEATTESIVDLESIRTQLSEALGIVFFKWLGCADLLMQSHKELSNRFPEAIFVLRSLRGKADKTIVPDPNEWCPKAGLPAFMYLPVPTGSVDELLLERHTQHWVETRDWDDNEQVGFWLYTAYRRALPNRMRYLADRIMNLELAFGSELYEAKLRQTIRGILAIADSNFDWEPYLSKKTGEQRL
ncbi:hypothetical protein ACQ4M3_31485 [Leptolyngbya sp. AN03gr2]|uniref:hypothetical protein n=1 Tax=unclassified Leptolyngbya TaxID=2650499 RepID=UPI003D3227EF